MKKLNKILCLLLVVVLVPLTPVKSYAFDNTDDLYSDNIAFLNSLDILSGIDISDINRIVTRAEFVSMVINMLNINHFAENDGTFTDVSSDNPFSSAIFTAYKFGLLKGTSETSFSPDAPVTYASALKILVAALGYEEYAYLNGGYPSGYIMQAKSIGVLDGVQSYPVDTSLSLGVVTTLISNSLTTDIRKVNSVGDDYIQTVVNKGENCLTQYFHLSKVNGVVTTAGFHSMIDGYSEEKSYVQISDLMLSTSIKSAEKYLGYNADGWYNAKTKELVALKVTYDNSSVTVNAADVVSYADFKILVQQVDSNKEKSYNLDRGYTFVLNGRVKLPVESDFMFENGDITLIDNNGDKRYDVVIANSRTHVVVRGVNSSTRTVYDQKMGDIGLILKNEEGHHYCVTKDGETFDSLSLESNTVLEAAISGDGLLADVVISTASVRGTITEISEKAVYVDGKPYETTEYFKKYFVPELGQSGTFLLDTSGKLVYIAGLYIDSVQYGYFLDYGRDSNSVFSTGVYFKIFTDSGEVKIFELAEKVVLDGSTLERTNKRIKDHFEPDRPGKSAVPVYQLIRFATDANGNIRLIDTLSELDENVTDPIQKYAATVSAENSLTRYVNATKEIDSTLRPKLVSNAYWRKVGNAFIPHFTLGDTIIMEVPKDLRTNNAPDDPYAESAFRIIGTGNLPNYEYVFIDAFDYDESMIPEIVVLYRGQEKSGETKLVEPDQYAPIHLVEKVMDCVTESGDISKRIYSYADETFHITDIAPEVVDSLVEAGRIPLPGEAVRLSFNGNEINGIARDIRDITKSSVTVNTSDSNIGKACTASHTYVTGKVFSCTDGSNVVIKYDFYPMPEEGTTDYKNSPYAFPEDGLCSVRIDSATTVAIYNVDTGLVEHGDISQIADIRSVGEEGATYVCVGLDGYDPEMLIIYR